MSLLNERKKRGKDIGRYFLKMKHEGKKAQKKRS
jgi:phage anti-repressor protein